MRGEERRRVPGQLAGFEGTKAQYQRSTGEKVTGRGYRRGKAPLSYAKFAPVVIEVWMDAQDGPPRVRWLNTQGRLWQQGGRNGERTAEGEADVTAVDQGSVIPNFRMGRFWVGGWRPFKRRMPTSESV